MSTRLERASQHQPEHPEKKDTLLADSLSAVHRPDSSRLPIIANALDECVGAISLVEVTVHSLDSQQIASPEQEVLKRALQALWTVHDWIYDRSWDPAAECDEQGCRP